MNRSLNLILVTTVLSFVVPANADETTPSVEQIKSAITKSLLLLEKGARGSLEQRKQCFTCHNQGLPILAFTVARAKGFEVDGEHLQTQLKFIADFLGKNKERYLEGKGQGGQIDMAGYALWTLNIGDWKPDDTTAAVAEYFLLYQMGMEHYRPSSRRPPSEQSLFTSSYVAVRGLKTFGTEEQRERIDKRISTVREWLLKTEPEDMEDRVFRLRALQAVGEAKDAAKSALQDLVKTQREDGGWSQLPDMESDAYATGSALVAMHETGGMATNDPAYRKGLQFLISSQKEDGSWHVVSRSKPFQKYFESGYPHGKDQFISIAAGSWATMALAYALPDVTSGEK